MDALQSLIKQVVHLNSDGVGMYHLTESINHLQDSFVSAYIEDAQRPPGLRVSQLGKTNLFDALGEKLGLVERKQSETTEKKQLLFLTGHFYEVWLVYAMHRVGYMILESEKVVVWNGIYGHVDFVIENEEGTCIVECKALNDYNFKQIKKYGMTDSYGYVTQLACYSEALQLPAYWVLFNKNDADMLVVPLSSVSKEYRQSCLERAKNLIDIYNEVDDVDKLYDRAQPHPPLVEKDKSGSPILDSKGNLKLYVPPNVKYPEFHYICEEGKTRHGIPRLYVEDYFYLPRYQHLKPNIIEDAVNYGLLL